MPDQNTNNAFEIPKIIIWSGQLIQFFSSYWAMRYAILLFGSPQKHTLPKREQPFFNKAKSNRIFVPSINKEIQIYRLGSSVKKVLITHGWSGRGTQMFSIAEALVEEGYEVVSFDGPAHGESSGKQTFFEEFVETILHINKMEGRFHHAVGHSFGGMVLLNALHNGMVLDSVTIISSGDKVEDVIKNFIKNLHLSEKVASRMIQYIEKRTGLHINKISSSEFVKDSIIPGLIIHDEMDTEVSVSCAHQIHSSMKNGTLLITKELGHRRILRNPKVVNHIINFIKKI